MKEDLSPLWKQKIRPYAFVSALTIFYILMFIDGNLGNFHVRDIYLKILEGILTTMIVFYFTSRGIEKAMSMYTQGKIKTAEFKTKQPSNITKENESEDESEDEEIPAIYKKVKKDTK